MRSPLFRRFIHILERLMCLLRGHAWIMVKKEKIEPIEFGDQRLTKELLLLTTGAAILMGSSAFVMPVLGGLRRRRVCVRCNKLEECTTLGIEIGEQVEVWRSASRESA